MCNMCDANNPCPDCLKEMVAGKRAFVAGMEIVEKDSFPPDANPFHYDAFNMGTYLGTNVALMYGNHPDQHCGYLIVVNRKTGKRMRIDFGDAQ